MSEDSGRCSECVRSRKACDGTRVASSCAYYLLFSAGLLAHSVFFLVTKLVSQEKKLEQDEEDAGEDLLKLHEELAELQTRMAAAAGRLSRLRKTRSKVKERRSEMVRRGLQGLEEEDALLDMVDAHERWVVHDIQAQGIPNDVDWATLGLGDELANASPLIDPSLLASGVVDESSSGGAAHG
jgi:hypothetical protein